MTMTFEAKETLKRLFSILDDSIQISKILKTRKKERDKTSDTTQPFDCSTEPKKLLHENEALINQNIKLRDDKIKIVKENIQLINDKTNWINQNEDLLRWFKETEKRHSDEITLMNKEYKKLLRKFQQSREEATKLRNDNIELYTALEKQNKNFKDIQSKVSYFENEITRLKQDVAKTTKRVTHLHIINNNLKLENYELKAEKRKARKLKNLEIQQMCNVKEDLIKLFSEMPNSEKKENSAEEHGMVEIHPGTGVYCPSKFWNIATGSEKLSAFINASLVGIFKIDELANSSFRGGRFDARQPLDQNKVEALIAAAKTRFPNHTSMDISRCASKKLNAVRKRLKKSGN